MRDVVGRRNRTRGGVADEQVAAVVGARSTVSGIAPCQWAPGLVRSQSRIALNERVVYRLEFRDPLALMGRDIFVALINAVVRRVVRGDVQPALLQPQKTRPEGG